MFRMKERVNQAFNHLMVLHETAIDRDAVICESLLDTQLGKLKRLIVKRTTHDSLKEFLDELNEPFEPPEIQLSLKTDTAFTQHRSGNQTPKDSILRR